MNDTPTKIDKIFAVIQAARLVLFYYQFEFSKCGDIQLIKCINYLIFGAMKTPQNSPSRYSDDSQPNNKPSTQQTTCNKRTSIQKSQLDSYNTIKKYNHTNFPKHIKQKDINDQLCSLTQSQNNFQLQSQQQSIMTIRQNQSSYDQQPQPILEPHADQLSVIEQQQSVVSSSIMPMREKHRNLLPAYLGAQFSIDHKKLIQIQGKLDQLLDYLKNYRQKTKGQLFTNIRKTMRQNHQIFIDLDHVKQILYLKPDFYNYAEKQKGAGHSINNIIISLPELAELDARKRNFRQMLYNYINQNQILNNCHPNKIMIPKYVFPSQAINNKQLFQQRNQFLVNSNSNTNTNAKNKKLTWFIKSQSTDKFNPYDAFKPGNSVNFQQQIRQKVKQNQARIKAQRQKMKNVVYGCRELLTVFDQLPKIFKKREKCSMFKSSIIQDLDKCLNLKQEVISKIFQTLLIKHQQFFRVIEHKSGQIIQIQLKLYNQIRNTIVNDGQSEKQKQKQKEKEQEQEEIHKAKIEKQNQINNVNSRGASNIKKKLKKLNQKQHIEPNKSKQNKLLQKDIKNKKRSLSENIRKKPSSKNN